MSIRLQANPAFKEFNDFFEDEYNPASASKAQGGDTNETGQYNDRLQMPWKGPFSIQFLLQVIAF